MAINLLEPIVLTENVMLWLTPQSIILVIGLSVLKKTSSIFLSKMFLSFLSYLLWLFIYIFILHFYYHFCIVHTRYDRSGNANCLLNIPPHRQIRERATIQSILTFGRVILDNMCFERDGKMSCSNVSRMHAKLFIM